MTNKEQDARVAAVKGRIATEPTFAAKVFREIYARQKPDERRLRQHIGHDGRGFQEVETNALCRFYERLEASGWRMTPAEAEMLMKRMVKYAGQYVRALDEKSEADREQAAVRERARARRERKLGSGPSPEGDSGALAFLRDLPKEKRMATLSRMAERLRV